MKLTLYLKTVETIDIIYKKYIYYQEKEKPFNILYFCFKRWVMIYYLLCFILEKYYIQKKENNAGSGSGAMINK